MSVFCRLLGLAHPTCTHQQAKNRRHNDRQPQSAGVGKDMHLEPTSYRHKKGFLLPASQDVGPAQECTKPSYGLNQKVTTKRTGNSKPTVSSTELELESLCNLKEVPKLVFIRGKP